MNAGEKKNTGKERLISRNQAALAAVFVISCLVIKYSDRIIAFASSLLNTLLPLIYGFAIAYVLNIFMKKLERFYFPKHQDGWQAKTRRPFGVFGSIILVLILIYILIILVVPSLIESFRLLAQNIPEAYLRFQTWLIKLFEDVPELQEYVESADINWNEIFTKLGEFLQKGLGNLFSSAFSAANLIVGFTMTAVVALIFAIYMLFGKEQLESQIRKISIVYAPEKPMKVLYRFFHLANETFADFISGQLTEAFILGALCGIGMAAMRLPYAMMVGVVVGVTALIPVMGAYIGGIVGAFMIVTVSPAKAVEFLIFLVILQQIEGNLIYPRVVGGSIGLPGIWVLAAVTVGGGLLGVPGMLLGVPAAATLYKWIRADVNRKMTERDLTGKEENDILSQKQEE